jgi:hypothetical protein
MHNQTKLITFNEVVAFAKTNISRRDSIVKSIYIDDFDFQTLSQLKHVNPLVASVRLSYGSNDKIVQVLTKSKYQDSDFEFNFAQNDKKNYAIFFARQIFDTAYENEQNGPVMGFFLAIENRCFFIGLVEPLCVMELDGELKAIKTLRFNSNNLEYATEVRYREKYHIYSDRLYKPKSHFELTESTTIFDLLSQFDMIGNPNHFSVDSERRIGWVKELDHLPLWTFSGLHEYDYGR